MSINLTDNNHGNSQVYTRADVAALFPFADKSVAELCKEHDNLLVFPYSIDTSDDRIGNSSVFNIINTKSPDKVRIGTGNIMGFIGVGDLQIKIQSRFDEGRGDYFLHYMLQKVMSFNLFDLNHNNEQEDVFDFMMFMFPFFLKAAMRQGAYRDYQRYTHNDSNVRGVTDVSRHIRLNTPFGGRISYSTREYSYDNSITQLIRHTIELLRTRRYGQAVLNIDSDTTENVNTIVEHTPSYRKSDRSNVIRKNLRVKAHPYYTEYRPLQSLCLQILRMEEVKYGESDDMICGMLFDGAWLWEEYVNTILSKEGFAHPENRLGRGAVYLFEDKIGGKTVRSGMRYPDFYKDGFVLDAKYKRLGSYEKVSQVDRNDIHQVMAYMEVLDARKGGFVAPLTEPQDKTPTAHIKGGGGSISIYGIEIDTNCKTYGEFCQIMARKEALFRNHLR